MLRHSLHFCVPVAEAPHLPTQVAQSYTDTNAHIPGIRRREFAGMVTQIDEAIGVVVAVLMRCLFSVALCVDETSCSGVCGF